jgi:hypothetical protein
MHGWAFFKYSTNQGSHFLYFFLSSATPTAYAGPTVRSKHATPSTKREADRHACHFFPIMPQKKGHAKSTCTTAVNPLAASCAI